jgi:hypothetical protein
MPAKPRSARRRPVDRRASVRFLPPHDVICYWSNGGAYAPARVSDISAGGACLFVRGLMEPGMELAVELVNAAHTFLCTRLLRVVRVYQGKRRDAVVGGAFDRHLNYDELLPFIV